MASSAIAGHPALQLRLEDARARTDELFGLLQPSAIYERPVPDRHRLIFYLGHLEAFDWNQVGRGALGLDSFHPSFDKLFEFGIDPEPGKAPSDTASDWPSVEQIKSYNAEVRRRLDESLAEAPEHRILVAIEHRLMHAETFAYLLHNLPYDRKVSARLIDARSGPTPLNLFIAIPAGSATLGQAPGSFGWDNEFERHPVGVPEFAISRFKVANGEFLRFVEAGAEPPHFWERKGQDWFYRGMFAPIPLPLDWPVYATYDQAAAYAKWAGKSLPTEPQFHRAAYATPDGRDRTYPWGETAPNPTYGNFDFARWDPVAVAANPQGESAYGVAQLVGNGWEWTATTFGPFSGFESFEFYPGYSANFFDNAHYVMKGGSPRTAACLLRPSFRNWFRPNYPYAYAGFRLVDN